MKIKEFIKNGVLEVVEADKETAVRLLAEKMKWQVKGDLFLSPVAWTGIYSFCTSWNIVRGCELAVIEKVGFGHYGRYLWRVVSNKPLDMAWWNDVEKIATASAEQRLAAMLSALSEVE